MKNNNSLNNINKNISKEFNKNERNIINIKTETNRRNPIVLNNFNKENIINQKKSMFNKTNDIKTEKIIIDKSNDVNNIKNYNKKEILDKINKKEEINFNELLNSISTNKNNSEKKAKQLAKLNFNIYLNCIKNI